jgi:hypothetical protein
MNRIDGKHKSQAPRQANCFLGDRLKDGQTQDEREYHANAKDREQNLCNGRKPGCESAKSEHSEDNRQYGANQCPLQHVWMDGKYRESVAG